MDKNFIQYHNTDALDYLPGTPEKDPSRARFDEGITTIAFFTRKTSVQNEVGSSCCLIVGAGKNPKKYYLWSWMQIENVEDTGDELTASGEGFYFPKPIFLNELRGFDDFKKFCGNFGIGFQRIDSHPFSKTLLEYADKIRERIS